MSSFDEDSSGIGDAIQFPYDPRADEGGYGDLIPPSFDPRADEGGYGDLIPPGYDPRADENGYGSLIPPGVGGGSGGFDLNKFLSGAGKLFDSAGKFAGDNKGLMALLAALTGAYAGKKGVRPSSGGGTSLAYTGPSKPLTGTVTQGKYGPIMTYAANGGLMQAYAQGGLVQMESGGFVMTKKSVDGAGGPQGIRSLVPGAQMIRGPGTGTSDDVPAVIQGRHGQTPARLSNGEAYIPKQQVQEQGGAKRLYSLMNQLQGAKNA